MYFFQVKFRQGKDWKDCHSNVFLASCILLGPWDLMFVKTLSRLAAFLFLLAELNSVLPAVVAVQDNPVGQDKLRLLT